MWFGRPPGPQWLRPFLAALAGYVAFAVLWVALVRYFEPEIASDHGSVGANLLADLADGLGLALTGLLVVWGLIFLGLATLWGRFQLWLFHRLEVEAWFVSSGLGAVAGWILSVGFSWLLSNLSATPRDHVGPMIAGSVAGALAGYLLLWRYPGSKRRTLP